MWLCAIAAANISVWFLMDPGCQRMRKHCPATKKSHWVNKLGSKCLPAAIAHAWQATGQLYLVKTSRVRSDVRKSEPSTEEKRRF